MSEDQQAIIGYLIEMASDICQIEKYHLSKKMFRAKGQENCISISGIYYPIPTTVAPSNFGAALAALAATTSNNQISVETMVEIFVLNEEAPVGLTQIMLCKVYDSSADTYDSNTGETLRFNLMDDAECRRLMKRKLVEIIEVYKLYN